MGLTEAAAPSPPPNPVPGSLDPTSSHKSNQEDRTTNEPLEHRQKGTNGDRTALPPSHKINHSQHEGGKSDVLGLQVPLIAAASSTNTLESLLLQALDLDDAEGEGKGGRGRVDESVPLSLGDVAVHLTSLAIAPSATMNLGLLFSPLPLHTPASVPVDELRQRVGESILFIINFGVSSLHFIYVSIHHNPLPPSLPSQDISSHFKKKKGEGNGTYSYPPTPAL